MPRPHPSIRRAVVLVVDALRYDFAAWDPTLELTEGAVVPETDYYRNKLTVFHNVTNGHARLYQFEADPPTTTLQRLKGLTTGSLPTFIEMGTNFGGGDTLTDDSLLAQIAATGRRTTFLGDDTWMLLFPHLVNRTFPFPSLDVWDLHTVDDGVSRHLFEEMHRGDWDLLIGHFLGVDHAGHRYGPAHPAMSAKLRQLNGLIRRVTEELPRDAALFVLGDHGMDPKGDHGGDSALETGAALWIFAHQDVFADRGRVGTLDDPVAVNQIDLVPTLSLLLGLPIPMENLGTVIPDLFTDAKTALQVNAAQVRRYLDLYASVAASELGSNYARLILLADSDPAKFLAETLEFFRAIWARFDLVAMVGGIVAQIASVLLLIADLAPWRRSLSPLDLIPLVTAAVYFSNSFVVLESQIVAYLLQVILVVSALTATNTSTRVRLVLVSLAHALVIDRIAMCREEHGPDCVGTFHATTWSALAGFVSLAVAVVAVPRTANLQFRVSAVLLAAYWLVEDEWVLLPPALAELGRAVPVALARVHGAWLVAFTIFLLVSRRTRLTNLVSLLLAAVIQVHRPAGIPALVGAVAALDSVPASLVPVTAHLLIRSAFFATGHQATIASVAWNVGHTGLWSTHMVLSPLMVAANAVGHVLVVGAAARSAGARWRILAAECVHAAAASVAATVLRRHLMVWKIFAPRWMLAVLFAVAAGFAAVFGGV
ncbi:mannose-ethanolamine phosphotransferase gpi13 [Blastocladiella emersonii ATCC 22665]|nr:mannose-ethanolamine phosphotransferase gpi13 [Blastocladiella emersonii ATCC 22665]